MTTIFGYQPVNIKGMPPCPCRDGNSKMCEYTDKPLTVRFRCWCGRTVDCMFDSQEEMDKTLGPYVGSQ